MGSSVACAQTLHSLNGFESKNAATLIKLNLFFWSSFPEDCSDDGHLCEARALHAAAGHCVGDIGLRNVPEVPALSQERDRLCLRHALLLLPY